MRLRRVLSIIFWVALLVLLFACEPTNDETTETTTSLEEPQRVFTFEESETGNFSIGYTTKDGNSYFIIVIDEGKIMLPEEKTSIIKTEDVPNVYADEDEYVVNVPRGFYISEK